ncbi:MAG: hypothetical protein ACLQF0_04275 [Dissulfurispiraceae bacterium]
MDKKIKATEEQLAYANILELGMKAGLLLLIVIFIIYLSGLLPAHVPVRDLPKYWGMPVHKYLAATHIHSGWSWLYMIGKGDFLNFVSIAFLAGVTILCYLRIIPILYRKKDMLYVVFSVIEVLILALAASGILKAGD